MGGYDVYCAICGGPLANVVSDYRIDVYEEGEIYNREIVDSTKTEWLDRTRVIGENPESESMSKVFVSGHARVDDAGFFEVEAGDDPDFPAGTTNLQTYNRDTDQSLTIPFHDDCYHIFRTKVGSKAFHKGILYHTFVSHLRGDFASVPELDWGALGELQQQYFGTRKGDEEYVLCPTDIPGLQEYYAALPRLEAPPRLDEQTGEQQRLSTSTEIFAALPTELLFLLIDQLPLRDMLVLRQASAVVHELDLPNLFWRGRISRDMAWLYDIPAEAWEDNSVDWFTVCKHLYVASQRGHEKCMLALVNRRRIWTVMDQIMDTYFAEWSRVQSRISPTLTDAQAGHMSLLVLPEPTDTKRSHVELLSAFREITHAQPRISVHWTESGDIAGLSASRDVAVDVIGRAEWFTKSDVFVLPENDWLQEVTLVTKGTPTLKTSSGRPRQYERRRCTGIEFSFTRQGARRLGSIDGDRRVLRPMPGQVIVGFLGDCSDQGQLSKLAILQQPRDQFPTDCARITYATGVTRNMYAEKLLWRTSMPDPRITLSEYEKGYWGYDVKPDTLAMEKLVFGETDAERASITRISGDMHMGGFEVEYSDREPRRIGPRLNTMGSMRIDGAGGERIVCIVSCVENIAKGLRFVTNRGRVLVIGFNWPNQRVRRYSPTQLDGREVVGIYCSWLERTLPTSRLETFGVLSRDYGTYDAASSPNEAVDARNFVWGPVALPSVLTETGRLWGEWNREMPHGQRYSFPATGSIVSWLDCSRKVAEVEVVSCHPTSEYRLNVVGMAFRYADGERERVAIGYSELMPQEETSVEGFRHWCQCKRGTIAPFEDDGSHCWSDRWQPAQDRIQALRIWLDKHGTLSGMQLVDSDGNDSPFWGFTSSDEGTRGEISFGADPEGHSQAVGVKFFMNHNKRHVTYDDVVITALQAVAKA